MKTICYFMVILCMICNMIAIQICAESSIIDTEVNMLVHDALEIFDLVFYGDSKLSYPVGHPKENKGLSDIGSVPQKWYSAYYSVDPAKLPGGSIDGFVDYLKNIYTDSVAEEYCRRGYLIDELPLFVTDNDGDIFIVWNDAEVRRINMKTLNDAKVEVIDSNSHSAIARVCVEVNVGQSAWMEHRWEKAWVECKFENTPSGWRISDCAFFDMMNSYKSDFEWTPVTAPSTDDENVSRVWWLAGVSIAALVPAACLIRRRRRED